MQYKPHDYQTYATNFILKNPTAAILLDMGLGKSVITLTAIEQLIYDSFDVHRVLVTSSARHTAPKSGSTSAELERELPPAVRRWKLV